MFNLIEKIRDKSIYGIPGSRRVAKEIYHKLRTIKRDLQFKIRLRTSGYDIPNPENIYWINPQAIVYHTNFGSEERREDRVFDMGKDRGAVYDGDWDRTNFKFEDLNIYKALEKKINQNTPLQETEFYRVNLSRIQSGANLWGCTSKKDFDQRVDYIDELIKSIRKNGYVTNKENNRSNLLYKRGGEITVNIGRDGKFLFQDGRHRLAIAKILEMKKIPVQILVRHKEWQNFREKVKIMAEGRGGSAKQGYLYQPLLHPDLQNIPAFHECEDRFEAIREDLSISGGELLDIGANLGYFSFKFQEVGFQCTAIENNAENMEVMQKIKEATESQVTLLNNNILDHKVIDYLTSNQFAVVLALNIFHHFLKKEESYNSFKLLLEKLDLKVMYFEPHLKDEDQMKDSYINYSEEEFTAFILSHTKLKNKQKIYQAMDGRSLYRLD